MKYLACLFLALISLGCGKPHIDGALQPYVDQWNSVYPDHKVDVDMYMGDLSNIGAAGECSGSQVTIDTAFWNDSGYLGRQEVVFHELGHCVLNYGHDFECMNIKNFSDTTTCYVYSGSSNYTYIPRSVMFPWTFGDDYFYAPNLEYYLLQLSTCSTCTNPANAANDKVSNLGKQSPVGFGRRID